MSLWIDLRVNGNKEKFVVPCFLTIQSKLQYILTSYVNWSCLVFFFWNSMYLYYRVYYNWFFTLFEANYHRIDQFFNIWVTKGICHQPTTAVIVTAQKNFIKYRLRWFLSFIKVSSTPQCAWSLFDQPFKLYFRKGVSGVTKDLAALSICWVFTIPNK